jgi:PAS domain S-box-containing protein
VEGGELDSDGQPSRFFGVVFDITERKTAEAHLRQQWHTFDTALSHTPDFTYIFDLDGRFTYINRAFLSLWEKSFEDVVGKTFLELDYPTELAERHQREIQQVIATKQPIRDHTPFTGPTGVTRHYEYIYVPVLAEDGRVEAVAGSTRDVTDRERMEQALALSEKKLQQAFAEAPVAVCVLRGRELIYELANVSYQNLFPTRVLLGRRLTEAVPELSADIIAALHAVLDTGVRFAADELLIPLDRDESGVLQDYWFNIIYQPLRDSDGEVSRVVVVAVDVTAQVRARLGLERANRELEEFAYVSSHDLQEPLRMVNIYTQLLLRDLDSHLTDSTRRYAGFVQTGVKRMEKLLKDLLTFSHNIHVDSEEVNTTATADLRVSLAQAVSTLQNRIDEQRALVTVDHLPVVRGDEAQFAQIFQNLLSNALKYRKPEEPAKIRITATRQGSEWIISVADNGIGFAQNHAERIFGLFKRLHKDEYPGTGLGLAICKRIVERYGGRIWADSEPGKGATFSFSLPVQLTS